MNKVIRVISILPVIFITACSIKAPPYQASLENVQIMKRAKVEQINVGGITSSKELDSISLRGSKMYSPIEKSYGAYLTQALKDELKLAKLLSETSSTVITGNFITNDIDVSGFSDGTGEASAKFIVTKNEAIIFDKVIVAEHQFDSSFIGAIAIPNGQENYVNLVQLLIKNLFEDKEFINAIQ